MNYSILIISCDKHIGLLDYFFKKFETFFQNSPNIYLSLEKKTYSYKSLNITVINSSSIYWSKRVKDSLKLINNKSILLLLDDFIIENFVNTFELERISRLINNNNRIAHFALNTVNMKNESNKIYYNNYYKRHQFGRYKTTLQAGMWNKSELISLLHDSETAWAFEIYANMRSFLSNKHFYAIATKQNRPIEYNDGLFCVQGKINKFEMDRLQNKFNEKIFIPGIESNNYLVVRDTTKLNKRIFNRVKICFLWCYNIMKFYWKLYGKKI